MGEPMSTHHYPRRALIVDYGRAALGLGFTAGPLLALETAAVVSWIFGPMAALFGLYGLRTGLRHRYRLHLRPDGLTETMLAVKRIDWEAVDELTVRYFATRRDQSDGWMQITVKAAGEKISFDSDLHDYDDVMRTIWHALGHRPIRMNETTLANLAGLGYFRPRPAAEETVAEYRA